MSNTNDISPDAEEWRDIPGYEGYYQASNTGRIRSVDRVVRRCGYGVRLTGVELKQTIRTQDGRHCVNLVKNSQERTRRVHRLVLLAFRGIPAPGLVCCHNDGDVHNNHLSNLRWDTESSNQYDAVRHGTHPQASKTHCIKGHPLVPGNLYGSERKRTCRTCARERQNDYDRNRRPKRDRRKAAGRAPEAAA